MEAKQGSLGKGMTASKPRQSGAAKPLFTSLKNGMQQMTDAVVSRIPESARRTNSLIHAVQSESGKWLLVSQGRTEEFDAVVIATPAYHSGTLLASVNSRIAEDLNSIPYSSSVTVALGYDESVRASLPPGFGFLVPRGESTRLIATTFVHNKFPNRVPKNKALVRCFLGGTRDAGILQASDDEIKRIVLQDLTTILGIHAEPAFCQVYKWKQAMAQYSVGHGARVERIRAQIAEMRGLALAGNAYGGIGVPDCVRYGSEAAAKVLAELGI
jgi:oxygen-dependent protoporphyrinogen oxidase